MKSYQNIVAITKRFYLFVIAFFVLLNNLQAQTNLVPNYSFEVYINCPVFLNNPPPSPWYENTSYAGMYLNACNTSSCFNIPYICGGGMPDYQPAHTGQAYIYLDFYPNNRQYIQTPLKDSLVGGHRYYVEYFTNLLNSMKYACNNNGLLFTKKAVYVDTALHKYGVLPANPQIVNYGNPIITDTLGWTKVSGIYKAQGGEKFITIGNFKTDAQTTTLNVNPAGYPGTGYLIDDVSVIPLDSYCLQADAGKDTTITIGDSIFIGSYTNGIDSLKWLQNGVTIDSTRPGFWVKPTTGTSYILQQTINGCFSSDTVTIGVLVPLKFTNYELRITNENTTSLQGTKQSVENNWQTASEVNVSHFNILKSENGKDFKVIGTIKAQNKSLNDYTFLDKNVSEGVNYYKIVSIDFDGKMSFSEVKQLNVNHSSLNVTVFPNPAKDVVNISCVGMKEVNIINQLGQTVKQLKVNSEKLIVDIKQLPKGIYLLNIITTKNNVYNQKLIVQ